MYLLIYQQLLLCSHNFTSTDVDGVFSANPRIISRAKLLKNISYNEMLEAASLGSKVMHNRAVNTGKKYNIPIIVRNSQKRTSGSLISDKLDELEETDEPFENNKVKFITKRDNMTKISIEMISFSELSINIAVQTEKAVEFMEELHKELFE